LQFAILQIAICKIGRFAKWVSLPATLGLCCGILIEFRFRWVLAESGRFTKRGYVALGETVRQGLQRLGWEQQDLVAELNLSGRETTDYELSRFINASGQRPDGSLVVAIARVNLRFFRDGQKFLVNPRTKKPYNTDDLFDIACELLDPETGLKRNDSPQPADSDGG
jgi:hypothetical protein